MQPMFTPFWTVALVTVVTAYLSCLPVQAASRMERGQTTCIKCKGSGACACPNCKVRSAMPSRLPHPMQLSLVNIHNGFWLVCTAAVAFSASVISCMASLQGQGIVQPEKLRKAADPVRQAANKVSSLLGGSNSNDYTHMLRSNRQGIMNCMCPPCFSSCALHFDGSPAHCCCMQFTGKRLYIIIIIIIISNIAYIRL